MYAVTQTVTVVKFHRGGKSWVKKRNRGIMSREGRSKRLIPKDGLEKWRFYGFKTTNITQSIIKL